MPASTMASSPSKIPLPKRLMVETAPSVLPPPPTQPVSRIPKAVSPERSLAETKENHDSNGKKAKYSGDPSATFVRRSSPTSKQAQHAQRGPSSSPVRVDLDEQLMFKVHQARRGSDPSAGRSPASNNARKTSVGASPSRIPVAPGSDVKSRSSSCSVDSPSSSTRVSPVRQTSPPRKLSSSSSNGNLSRDSRSRSSEPMTPESAKAISDFSAASNNSGSRIPLPKSASSRSVQQKQQPTVGWSLSPERMEAGHERRQAKISSVSAGNLMAVASAEEEVVDGSERDDSDENAQVSGEEGRRKTKKKNFEAFVMTGDRMINLAKTPANQEFKSKYPKSVSDSSLLSGVTRPSEFGGSQGSNLPEVQEEEAEDGELRRRAAPVARRALVRNSKSEDQLNMEPQISPQEDYTGSVNTLLDTSGIDPLPTDSSVVANPDSNDNSPEIDTGSQFSMSENYNGQSVLEDKICSTNSSSSPETPEWSLIDSYHKANSKKAPERNEENVYENTLAESTTTEEESISNYGNRVVISIGETSKSSTSRYGSPGNNGDKSNLACSPTGSSTTNGTITPEDDDDDEHLYQVPQDAILSASRRSSKSPPQQNNGGNTNGSSEEDSDMESLHSYHPPVKVVDVPSAVRLAKRLYFLDGFKKTDVSRHLSKNTDYNHVVAEEYLKFFEFRHLSLDEALRTFLSHFCLTGETQERERVLIHFSRRFLECNPDQQGSMFNSQDAVHTLTCAIMLLNTDLHGDAMQRKMSCFEFRENLSELNDGGDFPRELLNSIYGAIKDRPIPWSVNDQQQQAQPKMGTGSLVGGSGASEQAQYSLKEDPPQQSAAISIGHAAGGINPFLSLPDASLATDYKNGYVMRKSCFDAQGKKTKLGKRSWKMFFLTLRDMVLYCFKDEKTVRTPGAFEDLSCAIRVHHGLAVRATDYTKKQFVFRLHTADQAQYLFQTSDEKELLTWIDVINYVVASFSSPQLAAPCGGGGGNQRFQRPLLPSSKTKLTPAKQLESHEQQLAQLREDLDAHLACPPPRSAKQSAVNNYKEKSNFLTFEVMRYETYILTLRTKTSRES